MIGQKIVKFDNMLDNSLKSFEKLFNLEINHEEKNQIVEILEPVKGSMRRVRVGDLDFLISFDKQDAKSDPSTKSKYFKYIATDFDDNVIAESYKIKDIAKKINISTTTVLNIIKRKNKIVENTGGRSFAKFMIKKIPLSREEFLKHKNDVKPKNFYKVFDKNKNLVKKFKGLKQVSEFLGVSVNTVCLYLNDKRKNKNGYIVKRSVL